MLHNIGHYHMYRFIASVWETGIHLNRFGLDKDLEDDNVTFKVPISILKVGLTAPEGFGKCPNSLDSNFVLSFIWDWKIASHHRFPTPTSCFFKLPPLWMHGFLWGGGGIHHWHWVPYVYLSLYLSVRFNMALRATRKTFCSTYMHHFFWNMQWSKWGEVVKYGMFQIVCCNNLMIYICIYTYLFIFIYIYIHILFIYSIIHLLQVKITETSERGTLLGAKHVHQMNELQLCPLSKKRWKKPLNTWPYPRLMQGTLHVMCEQHIFLMVFCCFFGCKSLKEAMYLPWVKVDIETWSSSIQLAVVSEPWWLLLSPNLMSYN